MKSRYIISEVPGFRSRTIYQDQTISAFLAGVPENETHADVVFEKGHGSILMDVDSNCFIDCANTLNLPFGHEPNKDLECPVINSSNYMTLPRYRLINTLKDILPQFSGFQFRSSGTESVEASLRYIRACFPGRLKLISLEGCYHGLTLAAQQIMGFSKSDNLMMLSFPDSESIGDLHSILKSELEAGPVVVVFESVQGNFVRALPKQFLELLMELKQKYNEKLLLFCDDMLISIRKGNWTSLPDYFKPDLWVGGKSWSGGYPFSFFGISQKVREMAGDILGTTTYGGNPVACQAVWSTIKRVENEKIFDKIADDESFIKEECLASWQANPNVLRAECYGLLFGIEMNDLDEAIEAGLAMFREGLICARINKVLRFSPALNISRDLLHDTVSVISILLEEL